VKAVRVRPHRCRFQGNSVRVVKVFNGMAVNHSLINHALTAVGSSVPHPNLVPVHAFNLQQAPYYCITDYYARPDGSPSTVEEVAGHLPVAWRLVEQLVNSLSFLHRLDVFYTCVKPGNIFVEFKEGKSRIFGSATLVRDLFPESTTSKSVIPATSPLPNSCATVISHGKGKRWDVYAFGVVAYYILNGKLPRLEERYRDYLRKRKNPRHPTAALQQDDPVDFSLILFEEPEIIWPKRPRNEYEEQLRNVIDQCLSLSADDRPADLREVARTFETIRHTADIELLKRTTPRAASRQEHQGPHPVGTTGISPADRLPPRCRLDGIHQVATEADKVVKAEQRRNRTF